jgi:two-component system nitrogen regulation sensor histidine kinase GlnL
MARMPEDTSLYLRILENMEEAVIAIDPQERIVLLNPAAQACTGLSERHAVGQRFDSIFSGQNELLHLMRTAVSEGRSLYSHQDILLNRIIGPPLPIRASVSPIYSKHGEGDGAVMIMRDLSQVRELEAAIRRSEQLSMLGTLAAGLAHEIKNPLGGIKGAAQLLNMELPEQSPLKEYTTVMNREVDRVNGLIEELLDLSRPPSTKLGPVNMGRVLSDIVLLQKANQANKMVDYQLRLDPSIPPILGDQNLLIRLFLNLIKNAGEAIDQEGKVEITSCIDSHYKINRPGERPVPLVTIEIRDTGRGIPSEQMEHIFTPFYTTKSRGTGLGLALCQKIVSDHRGFLKVESVSGEGTLFTVSLPLLRPKPKK